jgi:LAO/AO transport system kinase
MATRGALGGLSHSTRNAIKVLDAMGKDTILIETVGVGQDEVDVVGCADTTIVVLSPGMGDDIQAIKAGVLEIADIFVINKADLDGADKAVSQIAAMLDLDGHKYVGEAWKPPILKVEAVRNIGVADLMQAIDRHAQCALPLDAGDVRARDRDDARNELLKLVQTSVAGHCAAFLGSNALLDQSIEDIVSGKSDPYTESENLVRHILAAMPRD